MAPLAPPHAHAATHTVCPRGCAFTSIQAAIDAAQTGDMITITPGTYRENLAIPGTGTATHLRLQAGLGVGLRPALPSVSGLPSLPMLPGLPATSLPGSVIVDGSAGATRVLFVSPGTTVTLEGLTLRNGHSQAGAGIHNMGTLRLLHVAVTDNRAIGAGSGIVNDVGAILEATNSEVSRNVVETGSGGGILNFGTMTLTNVVVRDNVAVTARFGGGGINQGNSETDTDPPQFFATATLTNTILTGNRAERGGGLYLRPGTTTTIRTTVVSQNTATTTPGGGGIFAEAGATVNRSAT
ncbi:MAG: hypothetical protein AB7N70_04265, partial [Dehalococcoidia bacterium]